MLHQQGVPLHTSFVYLRADLGKLRLEGGEACRGACCANDEGEEEETCAEGGDDDDGPEGQCCRDVRDLNEPGEESCGRIVYEVEHGHVAVLHRVRGKGVGK